MAKIDTQAKATKSYLSYVLGAVVLIIGLLYQTQIKPTLKMLGIGESYSGLNNEKCHLLAELSGCEDQWIDRESGLSYLACTPTSQIKHDFFPPTHHLNTTNIPVPFTQDNLGSFFAILDTNTEQITKLRVEGFSEKSFGLFALHGLDIWVDRTSTPAKLTVFAINHLPPPASATGDVKAAFKSGADSVIEVFETELGSEVLTWKSTFRHKDVKTPNNVVAVSASSFYVTNDHKDRTSFTRRHLSPLLFPTSDIMYCNLESGNCFVAISGLNYPNGITKGPGFIYYVSSSAKGIIYVMQQQLDFRFIQIDTIKLGKIPDNLHVTEEGHIIVAVITKLKAFQESLISPFHRRTVVQPVQAIRVSNSSSLIPSVVQHFKVETIFSDPGSLSPRLQTATNVQYYKEKLYLTSCFSDALAVCEVGKI